uniref:Uncharacterized protein LOC116953631 n=1 Tax=Petromyzon marinus TaxID=7757 RepID=A0AAJ7XD01_PETMA|nr:uncharacterized protein LOC116953631 [Petromyzon marinus]
MWSGRVLASGRSVHVRAVRWPRRPTASAPLSSVEALASSPLRDMQRVAMRANSTAVGLHRLSPVNVPSATGKTCRLLHIHTLHADVTADSRGRPSPPPGVTSTDITSAHRRAPSPPRSPWPARHSVEPVSERRDWRCPDSPGAIEPWDRRLSNPSAAPSVSIERQPLSGLSYGQTVLATRRWNAWIAGSPSEKRQRRNEKLPWGEGGG